MSIWRKRSGIAIIKNTYLANGPHQMTVIVGDHISVFEGTDLWLRGKNLYTGKIGIFPLVCASFKEDVDAAPGENCDLDTNKYLLDENDLLKIEAQETIKYALLESANQNQCQNSEESQGDSNNREESDTKNNNENSESSTNKENSKTDKISKKKLSKSFPEIANRISDVITQLELCNKSQTSQSIISAHSALGKNIDNLRDALNLPINPRSFYSTMTTLSTWGRSTNQKTLNNPTNNFMNVSSSFSSSTNVNSELTQSTNNISNQNISGMSSGSNDGNKSNENRYVIIHACVDIKSLQKPMICRFFLYNATKKNFLALPLSLNVTPEKSTHDLVFDKIDRGMINSNLYLVIYTYEMKKNVGQPDQSSKRKNFACAVIPLPECDKNENFGNSTTIESQSVKIDEKAKLPPLHELLTSNDEEAISQAKLIRCIPNISVKITPFYGTTESVIQGQSLQKCEIIRPLLLPSSLTRNEIYSMLTVHLSNFNFDVLHKKTKMSFRLIDTGNKSFVPAIESIDSSLHNKTVWNCNQYKGRGFLYSEIFSVDLSVTKSPLKDLYLIVQVDKCGLTETKLSPNSFGVLPLASDIGSFTMKTKGKIRFYLLPSNNKDGVNVDDLCKFIEKNHSVLKKSFSSNSSTSQDKAIKEKGTKNKNAPKKVGSVNYNLDLASNQLTQNQELFKLLNYTEYTNDLKHSIENFMFCGISEWSKYSPNLLLNLCTIMANMPDFALSAFIAIQQMIGELTSNAGMKYKRSLIDFVEKEFNPFYPTANTNNLEKVSDTMIPLFISSLEGDVTDIKFRNFIKTLPFFLKLISRSYKINPTPERLTKINQIFSILNNIMKKSETVNEKNQNNHENNDNGAENNKAMATYTLMNQKILLLHFSSLLDDLLMCFEPSDSAKFINNFMESVDNENSTLINSKMQLLVDLSTKNIWHKDSTKLLNGLFLKELKEAILREDGIKIILQILPNIMHSSNSTFVISFLPLIDNLLKTSDNKLVLQLLMAIAFNFPKDFPLHLLIYLTKSNNLECSERLFIFVFVLTQKKDDIIKIYQKKDSLSEKYELFDLFWEIALSSKKKSKYPLDTYLSSFIYHFNNDFSILIELLRSFSDKDRFYLEMIHHILSCQILFPSKSLNDLYYLIYEADNHLNSNPNQTKRTTLRILWELSKDKNFLNLEKFMFINENYKDFSKMYHNAIGYISDVRTKPVSLREEDELSDALECLVHLSNDAEYPKFEAKMWKLLVSLNLTCRNHIEAVISMNNYLKLVPCDNEHIKPFLDFTAICGRELHVQMYFKMIELCIHSNFDEYAIPFIDELKNKCIIPFKHVELMPQLTKLESSIYYNISSKSRVNSVFFRVTFLGNQFNNYYRNRTFIYRRDYDPDASNIFKKEIKNKFINATIEVSNPPPVDENNEIIFDDKNMCIYIQSIMPAYQEEIDDAFYAPAVDSIPKYLSEFKENDNIVIFRSENAIIENEKDVISLIFYPVMQHYYSTKKTFPTVRRRIEIDGKRYFNRSLDAITYTTLLIHRQVRKLESEKFWLQNITKNGKVPSEAYIIKMQQAISRIIQTGAGKSKKYAEVFLHKDYLKKNPQQKEKIENLSAILDQQTTAIDDAIKYLITVETEKTKPLNQKILEHYTVMMLELKPLLRKPT